MASSSNIVPFPPSEAHLWIEEYQQARLTDRDPGTVRVYRHILQQFTQWVGKQAGQANRFSPEQITTSVVEQYLQELASHKYSLSHRKRARSVLAQFCQWLIEDKALLQQNPTRGLVIDPPAQSQPSIPRVLTPTQRSIFLNLMQQEDRRGKALFALGYWAGCRVTDIVELLVDDPMSVPDQDGCIWEEKEPKRMILIFPTKHAASCMTISSTVDETRAALTCSFLNAAHV